MVVIRVVVVVVVVIVAAAYIHSLKYNSSILGTGFGANQPLPANKIPLAAIVSFRTITKRENFKLHTHHAKYYTTSPLT